MSCSPFTIAVSSSNNCLCEQILAWCTKDWAMGIPTPHPPHLFITKSKVFVRTLRHFNTGVRLRKILHQIYLHSTEQTENHAHEFTPRQKRHRSHSMTKRCVFCWCFLSRFHGEQTQRTKFLTHRLPSSETTQQKAQLSRQKAGGKPWWSNTGNNLTVLSHCFWIFAWLLRRERRMAASPPTGGSLATRAIDYFR